MAQWEALTQQPNRALELYRDKSFPLDVRHYLASYIETRPWMSIPPCHAINEFNELINQLDNKVVELQQTGQVEMLMSSHKLLEGRKDLISQYSGNPYQMVQDLTVLLQMEHKVLTVDFQQQQQQIIPVSMSQPTSVAMETAQPSIMNVPSAIITPTNQPMIIQPFTKHTTLIPLQDDAESTILSIEPPSNGTALKTITPRTPVTPVTPMTPLSPTTPVGIVNTSIPTALNNLDNWGQNATIISQYIGNLKDLLNRTSPNKRRPLESKMKRLTGNLHRHITTIQQVRGFLTGLISQTVDELADDNSKVIEEIRLWREHQRRSMIGYPGQHQTINQLEVEVKNHAVKLETCLQQMKLALRHFNKTKGMMEQTNEDFTSIHSMKERVVSLIVVLVKNALVIEELPASPILKKDTRFVVTLRLLVGGHFGLKINLPEISSTLILTKNISQIKDASTVISCGDILNSSNIMEYFSSTNTVKLFLRKLMLKKIQRGPSNDKAGENRYCLCFTSEVKLHIIERDVSIVTVSPSLALVVHTRQVALAEASIIWDNAFSCEGGTFPEEVSWNDLAAVLSNWFQLHTGRGLSADNIKCLQRKIYGNTVTSGITWKQFAKESLCDRNFTFWDWIYSAYDLVDKCLKTLWRDGLLMGFVGKDEVQKLLSPCKPNTFILRFSDSQLGAISASWLHQEDGRPAEILHLQPNTHRGLSYISLAERIIGLPDLKYLYPDLNKTEIFEKYLEKQDVDATGAYVRQNISVSVDLPRHHSATLNSPLVSTDDLDDTVFDYPEFSVSPNSEMLDGMLTDDREVAFNNSVHQLEPSLADLDLDSLINTAQSNLHSISSNTDEAFHSSSKECSDLDDFFH